MDSPPKHHTSLFFFIFSIPVLYFLTIHKNKKTDSSEIKMVKRETREISTQTVTEYELKIIKDEPASIPYSEVTEPKIQDEEISTINSGIQIYPEVTETNKQEDVVVPSKRIFDYFAHIVSGK